MILCSPMETRQSHMTGGQAIQVLPQNQENFLQRISPMQV